MIRKIFLWFYRLDLDAAAVTLLLGAGCFLLIREKCGAAKGWKWAVGTLFGCCLLMILWDTLGNRTPGDGQAETVLTPLYSYYLAFRTGEPEIIRSNFMNAALFFPAGLLLCELLPGTMGKWKRVFLTVAAMAALSVGIEWLQFRLSCGRTETDDVIHNTLGALAGAAVCRIPVRWKRIMGGGNSR